MNSKCEALQAIANSRNFATAKPGIGKTEKEHILGLCDMVERMVSPVTEAMLIRAGRVVAARAGEDWDCIGDFARETILDTQRAAIEAALSTPVVPDETDSDKARTADHAAEPGPEAVLWQCRKIGHPYGWENCNRETFEQGVYGAKPDEWQYRALYEAPVAQPETAVRAPSKESHKGEPQP